MATASEIRGFLSRYSPEIATQLGDVRSHLAKFFPRGYELVYDNYNALVFAFGPSPKASELVLSIAGYPKWVTLFFANGVRLEDPDGLLEGVGSRIRSIRLAPANVFKSKPVQAMIHRAIAISAESLALAPSLSTIVKSVSSRQRPRRASVSKSAPQKAQRKKPA